MKLELTKELTKREIVLIKVGLFLVVLLIHYFNILLPLAGRNSEMKTKLDLLNVKAGDVKKWQGKEDELSFYLTDLEGQMSQFKQAIFSESEISPILTELSLIADKNQVKIKSIKPELVDKKEIYAQLPIGLVVEGDYLGLKNFMEGIDGLPWYCWIDEFELRSHRDKEYLTNQIRIFVLLEQDLNKEIDSSEAIAPTVRNNPFANGVD